MARYILYYNLNQFQLLDRKLLVLGKTPLRPEVGNLRKIMSEDISILWRHQILQLVPEKGPHLIETPPSTPSGVNSFSPGKVILDLRNGVTWEVLTGYE